MAMGTTNTSKPAAKKAAAAKPAAENATASTPETPEGKGEQREAAASVTRNKSGVVDRVAAVSYRADGTPDQTEGFEVLGDDKD